MEESKIVVEFSIKELEILQSAIAGYIPKKEDEMISIMLHTRITSRIRETDDKNSQP